MALSLVFCALFANSAMAQRNISWTGVTNNNWSTASNWNYPARTIPGSFNNPELNYTAPFATNVTDIVITGNRFLILVGQKVSGVGIPSGTTVTAVVIPTDKLTTTITLSQPTSAASDVAGNNLLFKSNTVITLSPNATALEINDISVGDKASGFGIPQGATVTAIDATNKKITININTTSSPNVVTNGLTTTVAYTNVQFKFATPKVASFPPGVLDIALISNGGNPTLAVGQYYLSGLVVSNDNSTGTASTITLGQGVEILVESSTNEGVLVKGGNIVNNGYLEVKSTLSTGANNVSGAYAMTFSLPDVIPSVPTEYTYSGSGELTIDTSAGNNFSGGFLFNGIDTNANLATYKLLFNGTTTFLLSPKTAGNGTATTHLIRAIGAGAFNACKVILGGTGFDFGTDSAGAINGLISVSGSGVNVTIAQGTTINMFSSSINPSSIIGMYVFGATAIPAFITNKGTLNIKGSMQRSVFGLSAQSFGVVNFVNDGVVNTDTTSVLAGNAIISMTNNGTGAQPVADVNFTNNGTMSLKTKLNGVSWGAPIVMTTFAGAPNFHLNNSGTLNIMGSNYSFGNRPLDPSVVPVTLTGASRITNSGTINANQEFRAFHTTNTSTGTITYKSTTDNTLKFVTINLVPATTPATTTSVVAAAVGTTYTDENANVYTVMVAKVSGAAGVTTLVAHVGANAINPPVRAAAPPLVTASTLTKTGSGAGDASIVFTGLTTNGDNAFFQTTLNSGTINTNSGTTAMTFIQGVTNVASTSVLSPGGDNEKGRAVFVDYTSDAYALKGTIKMQVSGNTAIGVDYDFIRFPGQRDVIDISQATLDLTGIYTPTVVTTVDILTTFDDTVVPYGDETNKSGVIASGGPFASVIGLTPGWKVLYTTLPGKVQLSYDPVLSTVDNAFSKFKFNYYPNPTSNQLNLSADSNISKVEIYNILGQKVQSSVVNATQKQLNVSSLQKGIYLMEVSIDTAKKTFKIVKE